MKLHSPVYLQLSELQTLRRGILARLHPISVIVKFHGLVHFTPVKIFNVQPNTFETGGRFPIIDLNAMSGCSFPYVFDVEDKHIKGDKEPAIYTTEYDISRATIQVYKTLENGDFLLCTKKGGFLR